MGWKPGAGVGKWGRKMQRPMGYSALIVPLPLQTVRVGTTEVATLLYPGTGRHRQGLLTSCVLLSSHSSLTVRSAKTNHTTWVASQNRLLFL